MSNLYLKIHSIDRDSHHMVISVCTENSQKKIDEVSPFNIDLSNFNDCKTGIDLLKAVASQYAMTAIYEEKKQQQINSSMYDIDLLNSPGNVFTYDMKDILSEQDYINYGFTPQGTNSENLQRLIRDQIAKIANNEVIL